MKFNSKLRQHHKRSKRRVTGNPRTPKETNRNKISITQQLIVSCEQPFRR